MSPASFMIYYCQLKSQYFFHFSPRKSFSNRAKPCPLSPYHRKTPLLPSPSIIIASWFSFHSTGSSPGIHGVEITHFTLSPNPLSAFSHILSFHIIQIKSLLID